jgi:putative PIN family toxin of toxin-antitoxin system
MLVVLDTNVIVSALLSSTGAPAQIMRYWEAGAFDVLISRQLLAELGRVLTYPKIASYLQGAQIDPVSFLKRLAAAAILVEPEHELSIVVEDPADNRVLECALEGGAAYIITGDVNLLQRKEFRDIVILPPVGFTTLLELQTGE